MPGLPYRARGIRIGWLSRVLGPQHPPHAGSGTRRVYSSQPRDLYNIYPQHRTRLGRAGGCCAVHSCDALDMEDGVRCEARYVPAQNGHGGRQRAATAHRLHLNDRRQNNAIFLFGGKNRSGTPITLHQTPLLIVPPIAQADARHPVTLIRGVGVPRVGETQTGLRPLRGVGGPGETPGRARASGRLGWRTSGRRCARRGGQRSSGPHPTPQTAAGEGERRQTVDSRAWSCIVDFRIGDAHDQAAGGKCKSNWPLGCLLLLASRDSLCGSRLTRAGPVIPASHARRSLLPRHTHGWRNPVHAPHATPRALSRVSAVSKSQCSLVSPA